MKQKGCSAVVVLRDQRTGACICSVPAMTGCENVECSGCAASQNITVTKYDIAPCYGHKAGLLCCDGQWDHLGRGALRWLHATLATSSNAARPGDAAGRSIGCQSKRAPVLIAVHEPLIAQLRAGATPCCLPALQCARAAPCDLSVLLSQCAFFNFFSGRHADGAATGRADRPQDDPKP